MGTAQTLSFIGFFEQHGAKRFPGLSLDQVFPFRMAEREITAFAGGPSLNIIETDLDQGRVFVDPCDCDTG